MRVFNEDKTEEITEYDLSTGYLKSDTLIKHVPEQLEQQEISHEHTIAEYPNGGKEIEIIVDTPYKPYVAAHDDEEEILVYKRHTQQDLDRKRIEELRVLLSSTDYKAIKYAEGIISEKEYASIKKQRQEWREEINNLENK